MHVILKNFLKIGVSSKPFLELIYLYTTGQLSLNYINWPEIRKQYLYEG